MCRAEKKVETKFYVELREKNNRMILTCSHLHTKASQPEKTENSSQLHGTDFSGQKVSEALGFLSVVYVDPYAE